MKNYLLSRRKFLESLGLGAGAFMLNPLAGKLFDEAYGQVAAAKAKVIFIVLGQNVSGAITPPDFRSLANRNGLDWRYSTNGLISNLGRWSPEFVDLERFKSNALFIDNMTLNRSDDHAPTFSSLNSTNEGARDAGPSSATIDFLLGKKLSEGLPFNGIRFGQNYTTRKAFKDAKGVAIEKSEDAASFARAAGDAIPHYMTPEALATFLRTGTGSVTPTSATGKLSILDFLREDAKLLKAKLASTEAVKLENYLYNISSLENKLKSSTSNCGDFSLSRSNPVDHEQDMYTMATMAAQAMKCGLSNVAGISLGVSREWSHYSHLDYKFMNITSGTYKGLGPWSPWLSDRGIDEGQFHNGGYCSSELHPRFMGFVARIINTMLRTLSGGENFPENTTVVFVPAAGKSMGSHHGHGYSFPAMILSSNPKIARGYIAMGQDSMTGRSVGGLYVALSDALGASLKDANGQGRLGDYSGLGYSDIIKKV